MATRNGKIPICYIGVMYILKDQTVKVKWNPNTKLWYIERGYDFTSYNDTFEVSVFDLMRGSKTKVEVICDYCGDHFETEYNVLINGRKHLKKDCCHKCSGKKSSEISKSKRANHYIALASSACQKKGYTLLTTIDEYTDVKMTAKYYCPIHGEQSSILENIINGHRCKQCSYFDRGRLLSKSVDSVLSEISRSGSSILLNPNEYRDSLKRNLRFRCSCGREFVTSFTNYTKAGKTRCSTCTQKDSVAEKRIMDFLDECKIDYQREKRFKDCRDIKPLPFDFHLLEQNLIIEYDGMHHYFPVRGEDAYKKTKIHDKIKDEYCKENNIDLLRIPYWETGNMIDMIREKLAA